MDRDELVRVAETVLGTCDYIESLAGDASSRRYFRAAGGGKTCVLCLDEMFRGSDPGEYPFAVVQRLFFNKGIRVPDILSMDNRSGILILEDLGDELAESVVPRLSIVEQESVYRAYIGILLKIQTIPDDGSVPFTLRFDVDKLMFEFDFFIRHGQTYFGRIMPEEWVGTIRNEFMHISEILYRPELFVLNHRDYHCRNIMLSDPNKADEPCIIDFQDARLGLPLYDIVSLLRDSYLSLGEDLVGRLADYHYEGLCEKGYGLMSRDEYRYYFNVMGFQRNVKALGTFAYQCGVKKNRRYEDSIGRTIGYLHGYVQQVPGLRKAFEFLQQLFGEQK